MTAQTAWSTLADALHAAGLMAEHGAPDDRSVTHLTHDSRQTRAGSVFVALEGQAHDGHAHINRALQNGATAIVCEKVSDRWQAADAAIAHVSSTRKALAILASTMSRDAHKSLKLYGITGTNGKTTTCYLLHHMLSTLNGSTGMIGTVAYQWAGVCQASSLTTPDAVELHTMMQKMVAAGSRSCVMEVSSHALKQDRTWGLSYQGAVFTNLSQDHLDYHTTWSGYRNTKRKLFVGLPAASAAVYNADDPAGQWMVSETSARRLSYGMGRDADIRFRVVESALTGLRLQLDGRECYTTIAGDFNGYNLAAAYAVARSAGFTPPEIIDTLGSSVQVPGRFECLQSQDSTTVVVDYAHTPDALEKVLRTLRSLNPPGAALWCVFGCGGDRDRRKRPVMGRIAETVADHVIVAPDNARTESQTQIFDDIAQGMDRPEAAQWLNDRKAAIRSTIQSAAPGDVILVAGRGHETLQQKAGATRELDDRYEAQQALHQREVACSIT